MFRFLTISILLFGLCASSEMFAAELRLADKEPKKEDQKNGSGQSGKAADNIDFTLVDAGPGFGPVWLDDNSLGFAYIEFDAQKKFPFNNLVFTKIRYDGNLGSINDIFKIPVGNSVLESSVHFVYDARFRQLGYMISNAADRFGSAHGLQVGVQHLGVEKARIYLESPYYLTDGYDQISGASLSPDMRGFVVSFNGDIFFIPFGDPGARDTPQINEIYRESYLPNFDDSTIGAELMREGKNTRYPVYFSKDELLFYENNDILLYNIKNNATNLVATVGKDIRGLSLSRQTKQIAILKGDEIIRYDIAGNEIDRFSTGIYKARNLSWSPDERYFAFDDIEKVYIVELDVEVEVQPKGKKIKPSRVMPQVTLSCGSADKIMGIRQNLEQEIKNLKVDVGQNKLIGLRKVSGQLRQLANCQSTIVRGGTAPLPGKQADERLPDFNDSPASSRKSEVSEPSYKKGQFQVLEEKSSSDTTNDTPSQPEGFRVKKPGNSFNKFRDSPDML